MDLIVVDPYAIMNPFTESIHYRYDY
jgi:hypothetical protein